MLSELDIVRDVSQKLSAAGIAYMLTGSMAMNYYAEPRMTRDIDIVVALVPSNAETIVRLFDPDYYVSPDAVAESIRDEWMFNLIHNESVIKVDCIVRKSTPYRREEFQRRQQITVTDFETWIVSKEDLILSKLVWAKDSESDRQLQDVRNLIASGYDDSIIKRWAQPLGVDSLWRSCQS